MGAAAIAAQELGWSTLAVWDEYRGTYEEDDRVRWVRERADAAFAASGGDRVALVGKSVSSYAAEAAVDRALPAVWYTPLLVEPRVAEALRRAAAPTLLVGGTADPAWDASAAAEARAEVLQIDGLDHGMQVAADLERSLAALRQVAERTRAFLAALS